MNCIKCNEEISQKWEKWLNETTQKHICQKCATEVIEEEPQEDEEYAPHGVEEKPYFDE